MKFFVLASGFLPKLQISSGFVRSSTLVGVFVKMTYDHLDRSKSYSVASGPGSVSKPAPELKLYQFVVFCIPILFTFILLFLFYLLYLRRRRADWTSIRMRTSAAATNNNISTVWAFLFFVFAFSMVFKVYRMILCVCVLSCFYLFNDFVCSLGSCGWAVWSWVEEGVQRDASYHCIQWDILCHWYTVSVFFLMYLFTVFW